MNFISPVDVLRVIFSNIGEEDETTSSGVTESEQKILNIWKIDFNHFNIFFSHLILGCGHFYKLFGKLLYEYQF